MNNALILGPFALPDTLLLLYNTHCIACHTPMPPTPAAAEEALRAKTDQLRHTRDEWPEGARTTVRANPLASVATALALGTVRKRTVFGVPLPAGAATVSR